MEKIAFFFGQCETTKNITNQQNNSPKKTKHQKLN